MSLLVGADIIGNYYISIISRLRSHVWLLGTSIQVGKCTDRQRMHSDHYTLLLGEDENGYGLCHRGYLYHRGRHAKYMTP